MPILRPYRGRIAWAVVFLVMAAVSTLVFPVALKSLIDQGIVEADPGQRVMALREHFFALFAVGAALGGHEAAAILGAIIAATGSRALLAADRRRQARALT